jgi:hypothetical protein
MHRSRFAVLPLVFALAVACPPILADTDEREAAAGGIPDHSSGGSEGVRLSPDRQQAGGLAWESLRGVSFREEVPSFGKVLDVQPLLAFRVRHRSALAEAEVAAAALALAGSNRGRIATLVREEIVAARELVRAESEWQAARARDEAAKRLVGEIRREAESAYGPELSRRVLDGDAAWLDGFAARRRHLLWVVLPAGQPVPGRGATVWVSRESDRSRAVEARLIAPAPRTDELVQGETWFFEAADDRLRSGMRVNVWAPGEGGPVRGVVIPAAAVVWHDGRPWAYRRAGADRFVRTPLEGARERPGGWFVARGFAPGEAVVTRGGQMLLSEELRRQIPDED